MGGCEDACYEMDRFGIDCSILVNVSCWNTVVFRPVPKFCYELA